MKMETKIVRRLTASIKEANRFIQKAEYARERILNGEECSYRSISFAAAKRAALDLKNMLTNLRTGLYEPDKHV